MSDAPLSPRRSKRIGGTTINESIRKQREATMPAEPDYNKLRQTARENGHEWWPCSKRSLTDYPTECDQREARKPLIPDEESLTDD